MKELILINSDLTTKVDDKDYLLLNVYTWKLNKEGYAYTQIDSQTVYLHRLLMKAPKDKLVDHINRKRLDNQRSNLRLVTYSQNNLNIGKRKPLTSSSKYKGVHWDKSIKVWKAHFMGNYIGAYKTEEEAALAYDNVAKEHPGGYACINNIDPETVVSHRRTSTTSNYIGVTWFVRDKCWKAQIMHQMKQRSLGYYELEVDAAIAWNIEAIRLRGEDTKLNLIPEEFTTRVPQKIQKRNFKEFTGVTQKGNSYIAMCTINKKTTYVGSFSSNEEARDARTAYILEHRN